jgi:hypothetical protein
LTTAQTQVEEKHSRAPAMQLLSRLARYAKPYIWVIVLSFAVSAVLAGGRYGRAYIMKPLLDDVLIPFQLMSSEDGRDEDLPLIPLESSPPVATTGSGDPITAARVGVGVGSDRFGSAPVLLSRD